VVDKAELQAWWNSRTDEQRHILRQVKDVYPLPSGATMILFDTRCPVLPPGARFTEATEYYSFNMPSEVAAFIEDIDRTHP
jgi:hypothetical protein